MFAAMILVVCYHTFALSTMNMVPSMKENIEVITFVHAIPSDPAGSDINEMYIQVVNALF